MVGFFNLERGVRQGCPLSAYLFILAIEILANKIRHEKDIKGIIIDKEEIKLSMLAPTKYTKNRKKHMY